MGLVNFLTDVEKTVEITKSVDLSVDKQVFSNVQIEGSLATAEASADAIGSSGGPIVEGFELVGSASGLTRGEIHAEWWDRAINFPTGNLSFAETDGSLQGVGQDVPGVFLVDGFSPAFVDDAGALQGGEVSRSFVVPFGDTLAIPLSNAFFLATDPAEDPVQEVTDTVDAVDVNLLRLTVDGVEIPLADLVDARAPTGLFEVTTEAGGFLDNFFDPGEIFDAAADGFLVLLEGLDPGSHTIVFGFHDDDGVLEEGEIIVTDEILVLRSEGILAETDTFAQVTSESAFSFSESLAAVSFTAVDDFVF